MCIVALQSKMKLRNKVAEIGESKGECMELVQVACFDNLLDRTHPQAMPTMVITHPEERNYK